MAIDPLVQSISNNGNCAICFELLIENADKKVIATCTHIFHQVCIDRWLVNNNNCPECRADWKVLLISDATNLSHLIRNLINHCSLEKNTLEKKLTEKEFETTALKNRILELERNGAQGVRKKPPGKRLDHLTPVQIKVLADNLRDAHKIDANLQTFIRELFHGENPNGTEANEAWKYFFIRRNDRDIIHQIFAYYSESHYISIEQLKNICIRCGLFPSRMDNHPKR